MPIFKRRPKQPGVAADRTLGNALARRLLSEAERGNWQTIRDELSEATDWDERELLVSVLTETPGAARWTGDWLEAEPDSALALTADGARQVYEAWEVRGGAMTSDHFDEFHRMLAAAEDRLRAATAADDRDPTPWVFLVMAGRGLEVDLDETEARFGEVTARHPRHRSAHNQMLQALTAKWGGSHDLMFNFARDAAGKSPEGNGMHALVAEAHIERNLAFRLSEPPDREGFEQYWRRPKVAEEIDAAANRSVLSSKFRSYARAAFDRNLFAYCFWMGDNFGPAARLFEQLGDTNSDYPWYYLGDSGVAFARARDESLERG